MLHHQDVDFFLNNRFKRIGEPLGAILNTEKTRIMITTTDTSLVEQLKNHHNRGTKMMSQTTKVNGLPVPVEVVDGLRVLGSTSWISQILSRIPHQSTRQGTIRCK
jgi:hypothetical protein